MAHSIKNFFRLEHFPTLITKMHACFWSLIKLYIYSNHDYYDQDYDYDYDSGHMIHIKKKECWFRVPVLKSLNPFVYRPRPL